MVWSSSMILGRMMSLSREAVYEFEERGTIGVGLRIAHVVDWSE
jgi:hypothetical protein